jgi:cupin superfamily acireductone dioxygenase involved in methionine salvage
MRVEVMVRMADQEEREVLVVRVDQRELIHIPAGVLHTPVITRVLVVRA